MNANKVRVLNFIYICIPFMHITTTKTALHDILESIRRDKKQIGFVPTMGALHQGHLSLINKSKSSGDYSVASIFVNPTQFNNPKDLERYPRIPEKDLPLLKSAGCDVAFMPSVEEMYPVPDTRQFNFGTLGDRMEGKYRPGHFNGMAQIVSKLFELVKPDRAYFGEKDFQQLTILQYLNETLGWNVSIVPCPIVRENDGLAMSSRNALLSGEERKNVAFISQTLFEAVQRKSDFSLQELINWVIQKINKNPYLSTEYFEIVHDKTLEVCMNWNEKGGKIGCIAVNVGKIRLIDNVRF
jgi:pantoate--beta-alanine ligase